MISDLTNYEWLSKNLGAGYYPKKASYPSIQHICPSGSIYARFLGTEDSSGKVICKRRLNFILKHKDIA